MCNGAQWSGEKNWVGPLKKTGDTRDVAAAFVVAALHDEIEPTSREWQMGAFEIKWRVVEYDMCDITMIEFSAGFKIHISLIETCPSLSLFFVSSDYFSLGND